MTPNIRGNALWFATSLVLAFMVWIVATLQTDPIGVTQFNNVSITMIENDAMILTNRAGLRRTVTVNVRAPQSVRQLMTAEDLTVTVDLSNLPAGTHAIPLKVSTPRSATVDTRPAQITVTLERSEARQKPVEVVVIGEPPTGYSRGEPQLSTTQVVVTGTLTQVDRVSNLRAIVDLSDRRSPFSEEVTLIAVNANGTALNDVVLGQDSVRVNIDISQREDVMEIPIRPLVDFASAPTGYVVRLDTYTPQTATLRGSPLALSALPDLLDTATIDLSNRTQTFTVTVPVVLPETLSDSTITILEGQTVEVRVVVEASVATAQFDDVPVTVLGVADLTTARIIPSRVTVLVTGPQPLLDGLEESDINVTVDVDGLAPGTYDLVPRASLSGLTTEVRVIPGTVGIIIEAVEAE